MFKNIQPARARESEILSRAASVRAMTIDNLFDAAGNKVSSDEAFVENLKESISHEPMFEGVDPKAALQIAGGWALALKDYQDKNGALPADDLLANAHASLENLMLECAKDTHEGSGKAMFESAAESMRTSDGVFKIAQYAALILPVSLGAATSDACTFVPCEHNQSDIYELFNIAGSSFGDYKPGDELNLQSSGAYSQLKRIYKLKTKGDGSNKAFSFDIKDYESQTCPIISGSVRMIVNRKQSKVDDGDGNLYFNGQDYLGNVYAANAKVDYAKGTVDITFTDAPAQDTEIAIQAEINVERAPELIPVINQAMRKWTVSPSQYVLASEHTVMAASDASREFNINLATTQFNAIRNWLSHEQDMMRLRTLVFYTVYGREFDIAMPQSQSYDEWVGIMRNVINALSQDMSNRTLTTGIRGGFAGADAANFFRSLPPQHFQIDPNYVQSPRIQYIGTLFGSIRIYEVPKPICESMTESGYEFGLNDIFFYGRGEGLGKAGLIAGDAVPAIPYVHETNPSLVNRTTLWGSAINEVHPRNGENYFARLTLTNKKGGSIDLLTGLITPETDAGGAGNSDGGDAADGETAKASAKKKQG